MYQISMLAGKYFCRSSSFQVMTKFPQLPCCHYSKVLHLKATTINVSTIKGKNVVLIEMLEWCQVDVCSVQQVKWRVTSASILVGKRQKLKFFLIDRMDEVGDVGILLAEKWVDNVI